MTDHYVEAVRLWQASNKNMRLFAQCCAMVDGRKTSALAADCKVSVDFIEAHRNAYRLYCEIKTNIELPLVTEVWDKANEGLWVKAAQLRTRLDMTLDKTWDYLQIASDEGMSRETFAAHVDTKENHTPQWLRRLKWVASKLFPSKDDWKTEMPIEKRERYDHAVAVFTAELKAIAEETVEAG